MPFYETTFIARQDISATQAEALGETFAALIKEQGGEVTKREYWGLRNLSFRIKKNRKGHYMLLNIDGPPAAVLEMERTMRINEDVLRYLTIKVDELEAGQSAMLQRREERGDRDRGDRGFDRGFGGGFDRGDRGDRGGFRRRDSEGGDDRGSRDAAPAGDAPRTDGGAA
jgi:small subunit ribosomal protein S6